MTDFTNEKAREWWYTQLDKVFIDGVYGFKVDQGEIFFGDTVMTSVGKMTNRDFRRYYYDAMSDYVRMRKPEGITIGPKMVASPIWFAPRAPQPGSSTNLQVMVPIIKSAWLPTQKIVGS